MSKQSYEIYISNKRKKFLLQNTFKILGIEAFLKPPTKPSHLRSLAQKVYDRLWWIWHNTEALATSIEVPLKYLARGGGGGGGGKFAEQVGVREPNWTGWGTIQRQQQGKQFA